MKLNFSRKRRWILWIVIIAFFFAVYLLRIAVLNHQYPNAERITGTLENSVTWNGMEIQLTSAQIINGGEFEEHYSITPVLLPSADTADYYALFSVSITRISENDKQSQFRLEYCGAENNGWHNLIDVDTFRYLNPDSIHISQMSIGDTQNFLLAFCLYESAFKSSYWENLSIDDFSLVLSVYPQKVTLRRY